MYKDDNHKPEMAIALSDFEALCGFVEHAELLRALETVPELQAVIGQVRLCMRDCETPWRRSFLRGPPTGATLASGAAAGARLVWQGHAKERGRKQ